MSDQVSVRVPASSANLGPGFDSFAAALALHCEVEVQRTGEFAVVTELDIATDRKNLVVRGFEKVADPSEYEFRIASTIPLAGGLGSSAAAVVAGAIAAKRLAGADVDVLEIATEIERHPDNAAAALYGGFVICHAGGEVALQAPGGLAAVLAVPHEAVGTSQARAALPEQVPLADAVYNLSGAAALAIGIERGDLELIASCLEDRLHQQQRAHLFPQAAELMGKAVSLGALGATVSGAGPTILFWCEQDKAADVEAQLAHETRGWAMVHRADFETTGATTR